jgi:uncharacterized protein (TIGR03083 family)
VVALDAAYAETKAGLLATIDDRDDAWSTAVPATPAWTVLDVVAHVTGIAVAAADADLPVEVNLLEQFRDPEVAAARDEFADGHVLRRRERSPVDVVAEWDAAEPRLLERIRIGAGDPAGIPFGYDVVLVTDVCVHADDVALALGAAPNRGSAASRVAVAGYCFGLDYRIRALGLPGLTLRYGAKERTLGGEPVGATLTADPWELLRTLSGRRSRAQIAAMDWTGDPEPYLPLIPAYGERSEDLVEG